MVEHIASSKRDVELFARMLAEEFQTQYISQSELLPTLPLCQSPTLTHFTTTLTPLDVLGKGLKKS